MNIQVDYNEIYELAKSHFDKDIEVKYINPDTCQITASIEVLPMLHKCISITADVKIDEVKDNNIFLTVLGNSAVEFLLPTGISYLKKSLGDMVETGDRGKLVIHLCENAKLKKFLEYATLTNISFDENSANMIVKKS